MSLLARVLETEAMDTAAEAEDYDAMDHAEVNHRFVVDLLRSVAVLDPAALPDGLDAVEILDLGTGTAQIPILLCRRLPGVRVTACDLAAEMLRVARWNLARECLLDRVTLVEADAKDLPEAAGRFPCVVSNSIVHHVAEPITVLREGWRLLALGGLVFFRDLFRPADEASLRHLVDLYAADANEHQRQLFADSLRAALTVEEVRALVEQLGAAPDSVAATSDRHWTWAAVKA